MTNDEKEILRLRKTIDCIQKLCQEGVPDCPMDAELEQDEK